MRAILKMSNDFFTSKPIYVDNVHKNIYVSLGCGKVKILDYPEEYPNDVIGIFQFDRELGIIEVDNGQFEKLVAFTLKGFRV